MKVWLLGGLIAALLLCVVPARAQGGYLYYMESSSECLVWVDGNHYFQGTRLAGDATIELLNCGPLEGGVYIVREELGGERRKIRGFWPNYPGFYSAQGLWEQSEGKLYTR